MALRKEIKYIVPLQTAYAIEQKLDRLLARDAHCIDSAYTIRSLYFDTVNNTDYWDKIAGIERRKKLRLRIYNQDGSLCKLEVKQKTGELQNKESFIVDSGDAHQLSLGETDILKKYFKEVPFSVTLYAAMSRDCYRPAVQIEYDRTAWQYPLYDTRITLDRNVRASESNMDIFASDLICTPVLQGQAILEVKYNEKMTGFISDVLGQFQLTQESYSKYCAGRQSYYDFIQ